MGWKHYQTVYPPPPPTHQKKKKERDREPQVGRGLFGVHLHFNFQFSKSIKSTTFDIFLNLNYPLTKISLSKNAQKSPKNLHRTTK